MVISWTVVKPDSTTSTGGMHTLMAFVGCIGTLFFNSGLEDIFSAAFKGVASMLNGKAWPKSLWGLRMVVVALLELIILPRKNTLNAICDELDSVRATRTGRLRLTVFSF